MPEPLFPVEKILTLLAASVPKLAEATGGLPADLLRTPPAPGEWSVAEVLAHLRACADVWGGYMATILAEDNPAIRAVSPRTYIHRTDYPQLEFRPSFEAFAAQRAGLLSVLQPLTPEQWSRPATVKAVGKPITRTVQTFAHRLAVHEREHVGQIEAIARALRAR